MEIFNNKDKSVTKYLHTDGSETCIKIVPSQEYIIKDNELIETKVEREKYSVLISHSSGCPIGCKMCYLTIKKYPYHKLTSDQILSNVKKALRSKIKEDPSLKKKYIKVCWMGMGDAFLDLRRVHTVTTLLVEWAIRSGQAEGLDGVDIGTVFPKGTKDLFLLNELNKELEGWVDNPNNIKKRSPLRIFYSLHKFGFQRRYLIPNTKESCDRCIDILKSLKELCQIDVIFHHLLLENKNDSKAWIYELKNMFSSYLKDFELRILRYNECKDSPYKESPKFNDIIKELNESIPKIKYQISPGSEIKAACGQFICKNMLTNK